MHSPKAKKPAPKKRSQGGDKKQVSKKSTSSVARSIAKKEGQRGVDSRVGGASATPALQQMVLQTTDRTIDVTAIRGSQAIEHMALGIVLAAIKRGWSSQLTRDQLGYVYCAYVYLVQSFYSAMSGTVPTIQSAPRWYWYMTQALLPTTNRFKTSDIAYEWRLEEGIVAQVPPNITDFYRCRVGLGVPDVSAPDVNGFYQLSDPVYTPETGISAIKSLFEYWSSDGMTKMVPYYETAMVKDTSAFSAVYPEMGESPGATCGMVNTMYSERVVSSPLLAKFAEWQPPEAWRGWAFNGRSSGTPGYVLPRMSEFTHPKQIYNKIPPIFKFFDFDEFFEVLSLTLAHALERQLASSLAGTLVPCPLTALQVQILLRQTMIPLFNN